MKKILKILLISFIILVIIVVIAEFQKVDNTDTSHNVVEQEKKVKDVVIIKNGTIENENLINEFTNQVVKNRYSKATLEIYEFTDNENYIEKKIEYFSEESATQNGKNGTVNSVASKNDELYQFGYYTFCDENGEKKFPKINWQIKKNTIDDNVNLIFYSYQEVAEFPTICSYSLESSNYEKNMALNFHGRKDMGADKIVDKSASDKYDFDIYTVGGDVTFTVEGDMVYDFQKALNENVVTVDDILAQAKIDEEYGFCEGGMYSDGGTIEYRYPEYTIIKYNTLDENKDFVIGPKGEIRNQVDKILYNK